jgi:tetratricopeptide (TPR) repeat protein
MFRKTHLLFPIALIFSHIAWAQKCDSAAFLEAVRFQQTKQPQKAMEAYAKQLKRCEMTEAYLNRGFCAYALGDAKKAQKDFESAIRISKEPLKTRTEIGDYYMHIKEFQKAYQTFESIAKTNPNYAPAYFKMGRAIWKPVVGNFVEATPEDSAKLMNQYRTVLDSVEQFYNQAIALDSTEYEFWYMRGDFKLAKRTYESALTDFKKAIELKPFRETAKQSAGFACHYLGRYEEACEHFSAWAVLIDPSKPQEFLRKKEWTEDYCKKNVKTK